MTQSRIVKRILLVLLASCSLAFVSAAQQPDKNEIIKKARQSYYSLKNEGLNEFRCSMTPDWAYLLQEQRKADPAGIDAAVKKLQALHFSLTLGLDGEAQVLHNDLAAENEQVAAGLKQVYTGMSQMASGFFQTWSGYMISTALPDPGIDFQLDEVGSDYRLTYKEGTADVVTTMTKDFVITTQSVKSKEFDATLKPQFNKIAKGLVLASYKASYRGATPAEATELDVSMNYQEVNGFQFPSDTTLSGSYGGTPFSTKVAFTDCQASKH
jgi:hypothetical protein